MFWLKLLFLNVRIVDWLKRKLALLNEFLFTYRLFSVGVSRRRQREIPVDSLICAVNMMHSTLSPMSRWELSSREMLNETTRRLSSKIFNWNLIFDCWGITNFDNYQLMNISQRDTTNAIQRGNGLDLGADFDSKCSGDDGALVDKVYRWDMTWTVLSWTVIEKNPSLSVR